MNPEIPEITIGPVGQPPIDWRKHEDEEDPDDEALAETPAELVRMLGFDPAKDQE